MKSELFHAGAKIINLTPHDIVVRVGEREVTFARSGKVARVTESISRQRDTLCARADRCFCVPTVYKTVGAIEGLPGWQAGTVYIVSAFVLPACKGRRDVVAPDTGPDSAIRDDQGRITGVRRFLSATNDPIANLNENPPDDEWED